MQKITACLWFDNKAEEAAKFYTSIFKKSKIKGTTRYGKAGAKASGRPEGTVMTVLFELDGQEFLGLNGGPHFKFSPAISFIANCKDQAEIDTLWRKLSAGGEPGQCGWLTDKFGVSWQIVPANFAKMLLAKDSKKPERVMEAVLQMKKIDLKKVQKAYDG